MIEHPETAQTSLCVCMCSVFVCLVVKDLINSNAFIVFVLELKCV